LASGTVWTLWKRKPSLALAGYRAVIINLSALSIVSPTPYLLGLPAVGFGRKKTLFLHLKYIYVGGNRVEYVDWLSTVSSAQCTQ